MASRTMRRRRIWRLLLVVVGAAFVLIGVRAISYLTSAAQVRDEIARLRAEKAPLTAADLESPDVPDDQNAFICYQRAAGMLVKEPPDVIDASKRLATTSPREWKTADLALLREHVRRNAEALRLAHQGAQRVRYKSDTEWRMGVKARYGYLVGERRLVLLLSYRARIDLVDGRATDALDACSDALRLGAHVGADPTVIHHLVELSCRAIATGALRQIVSSSEDPFVLRHVMRTIEVNTLRPRIRRALAGERALGLTLFDDAAVGKYVPSDLRESPGFAHLQFTLLKDKAMFLRLMRESVQLADRPYYETRGLADKLEPRLRHIPKGCLITAIAMPITTVAFRLDARSRMESEVIHTAAAVKLYKARHGSYPKALADLTPGLINDIPIDEFTGKPLVYRRMANGFLVYSIGQNMKDDGGAISQDKNQGDIVYRE